MTEDSAKTVCLVKAVETSTGTAEFWSADDAAWASQGAAHVVGSEANAEKFIECRARLAWDKLLDRRPEFKRLQAKSLSRPWLGWLLVLVALAGGVLIDHIGPDKRINILAIPVLGMLLWNLIIYVALVVQIIPRLFGHAPKLSRLAGLIAGVKRSADSVMPAAGQSVAASFWQIWGQASMPLAGARAARFLHLVAAALATGVIASLYFRGIINEYKAGWESTFLDAAQLHGLMSFLFGGISAFFAIPLPGLAELENMRFSVGPGADAAPWIHRIAGLVALVVILPRLLLAALAGWRQRSLERRLPLDLKEPYFQRLLGGFQREAAIVSVLPYSFSMTPQMVLQLQQVVQRLFGPKSELSIAESIAFGGEDELPAAALAKGASLHLVIFNLAATPEEENHGALLKKLVESMPGKLLVLVDESAFRQRFAGQPERLTERRKLWQRFLAAVPVRHALCDLSASDASALYQQLDACLSNTGEAA